MENNFENFLNIKLDNYKAPDYFSEFEKQGFNNSLIMLLEIQKLIKKSVDIVMTSEVPLLLKEGLIGLIENFQVMIKTFESSLLPKENANIINIFNRLSTTHINFFEPSSSNKSLMIINAISNYESFFEEKSLRRLHELNLELDNKSSRVDEILKNLENPSAEKVLANYASEYAGEETKNISRSSKWLASGIITTIVFITLVLLSIFFDWFPAKLKMENSLEGVVRTYEIINIPVLVTKVLLVSLIVYFIVFCFKQYSINMHLAVVNQQKKNAFNSYTLFAASIGDADIEARKSLLMSLAKTIHESINTGFLSSKQSDQPLIQNVDLGKFMPGGLNG